MTEILSEYLGSVDDKNNGDNDDREAVIDELMALVDFGVAIQEPYVEIAAERCLRIVLKHKRGDNRG